MITALRELALPNCLRGWSFPRIIIHWLEDLPAEESLAVEPAGTIQRTIEENEP
jgi:hypothetical protein